MLTFGACLNDVYIFCTSTAFTLRLCLIPFVASANDGPELALSLTIDSIEIDVLSFLNLSILF